jgi:ATP-dependent DNA helicase RecG
MVIGTKSSILKLNGVGTSVAKKLEKLGIKTVEDLIHYYPRRYDDFSRIMPIAQLKPGQVTVQGKILRVVSRRTFKRGFSITEALIDDGTGAIKAVWFNQPYLANTLPKGTPVYASGKLEFKYNSYALQNPVVERQSSFTKNTARIVPIYKETEGLSSKQIRNLIEQALLVIEKLPETLPAVVLALAKPYLQGSTLQSRSEALKHIHFPQNTGALEQAKLRIGFEELFYLMLTGLLIKAEVKTENASRIKFNEKLAKEFTSKLAFTLTNAQRKAAWQILQDIDSSSPMNRLLQGDVGSGKTAVAAMATVMAVANKYQVAVMAPTEVLARQHYETFQKLIGDSAKIALLTGGAKSKTKHVQSQRIKKGDVDVVIGTHALLSPEVEYKSLGLVVIDEQHRFGVDQRQALKQKSKKLPHLLTMSATPIPRSLALTIYGDLDISLLNEMPPGRKPPITKVIPEGQRESVYKEIDQQIASGRQVFVVCPLINESDKLGVKSVTEEAERLKKDVFAHRKIVVLHGKLKPAEKQAVLEDFRHKKTDIIVSTTIVEVGIDIPNASVMLIEGAERFGLATLHQLRGRIGRGEHASYCYILAPSNQFASKRLKSLEEYSDGFLLAQKDLEMRGPGSIYGKAQHGLLDLKIANIADTKLINLALTTATDFMSQYKIADYPGLLYHINSLKNVTTLD